jgi:dolichol kinase
MIKQQMLEARQLIANKRYDEARAILVQVDHPTAEKWLTKLNYVAPVQPVQSFTTKAVIVLALYWAFWIPGLIANIVFLREATKLKRKRGQSPDGLVFLWILLGFGIILSVPTVLVLLTILMLAIDPSTAPFIYTLF